MYDQYLQRQWQYRVLKCTWPQGYPADLSTRYRGLANRLHSSWMLVCAMGKVIQDLLCQRQGGWCFSGEKNRCQETSVPSSCRDRSEERRVGKECRSRW